MNPILIVDDERLIAELIELTLLQAGYQCEIALDGDTAADKIEAGHYDLILLDIMLPGVSGYELMEYIQPTGTPVSYTHLLVIAPIVAACGVKIAKMSGRGLGHTGGTVDKMEAVPGTQTAVDRERFFAQVNEIGISVIGQSGNLAPADRCV